jgi:hypothetical protein
VQVDLKMISHYFDISSVLHQPRSSTHTHAEIDLYVINPIFHGRYAWFRPSPAVPMFVMLELRNVCAGRGSSWPP